MRSLAILDVGHGNCAVLRDRNGVVVIDTGPGSGLLEYLTDHNITRVDVVLLSHADKDHIGGVAQLLASKIVSIGRISLNTDSVKGSASWDDLLYELSQAHNRDELIFEVALVRDNSGRFNQGDVDIEILAPSHYLAGKGPGSTDHHGRPITSNSISAVIRLSQKGIPVAVFPGDVDEVGLDALMTDGVEAKAPLLVYPHHGGRGGTNQTAFLAKICEAFAPSAVVFSVARGRPKHPLPAVIKALRQHLMPVRIICTQLTKHCASLIPASDPEHLAGVYARGRETRSCCGGTVVIALDSASNILPDARLHRRFIASEAPTALCR